MMGLRIVKAGADASDLSAADYRWLLVNAVPHEVGPLNKLRVVTTFTDVTSYRQVIEGLKLSEEKYRGLVESLPLMLIQSDREMRITYLNPATTKITGYSVAELSEPEFWRTLIQPVDLPAMLEAFTDALAGRTSRSEIHYRAKDGCEKVCFVMYEPRRQNGEITGVTALAVDMTLQRQLEQQLLRAQRLEQVGRLASGIAHDFNNLLTVVMTLSELARETLPDGHPVRDDLRRIGEAGEQASTLAGQLLTFGKQRTVATRPIDVHQLAYRTLDLLRSTLPGNIEIHPCFADKSLLVQADDTQLQQVLINLCLNARDAMPQGGYLEIKTEQVESSYLPIGILTRLSEDLRSTGANGHRKGATGNWLHLSVCDNGHGMEEQVRTRIFDPFFSTKERGTGLGLAVVRQIVENLGGHIDVCSQPGKGSCFDIWLPLVSASFPALAAHARMAGCL